MFAKVYNNDIIKVVVPNIKLLKMADNERDESKWSIELLQEDEQYSKYYSPKGYDLRITAFSDEGTELESLSLPAVHKESK